MQLKSLGLIEIRGLAAGIEAADAAVKSANVELLGYELSNGNGWMTIKLQGEVAAVTAAVDTAKSVAMRTDSLVSWLVIPRPSDDLEKIVCTPKAVPSEEPVPEAEPQEPPANNETTDPEPTEEPLSDAEDESRIQPEPIDEVGEDVSSKRTEEHLNPEPEEALPENAAGEETVILKPVRRGKLRQSRKPKAPLRENES